MKNILKLVRSEEWRNKHPTFDVEPEILEWAKLHAEIWIERWEKGTQASWTYNRKRNNYIGLIGQKCFEITLQQMEIPYIHNDPAIDWRGKKNYDFRIPNIETIEIKSVDYKSWQERLLVKCSEWHGSDFVLAVKLYDEQPTRLQFVGYATKQEVQKFNYAENENPCKESPCYWEYLKNLHPASEFFSLLIKKTDCWKTNITEADLNNTT
jgi:hypothetical protein